MMAVSNDELLVTHLAPDELGHPGISNLPHLMQDPMFVASFHVRLTAGRQNTVDFGCGIAIEHEELPEVGPGGAQQLQPVSLRLGQSLFMTVNHPSRVVLDSSQPDESSPLQTPSAAWDRKPLHRKVKRR